MTFNSHAAFNRLVKAGMTQEQAEAVLDTIAEHNVTSGADLATKTDIAELKSSLLTSIYFALLGHFIGTITLAAGLTFAIVKFLR